jgi:hypothetical protein
MKSEGNTKALGKAGLLLALLPSSPLEFYDRVRTMVEVRLEPMWVRPGRYQTQEWPAVVAGASQALGHDLNTFLVEPAIVELEEEIRRHVDNLRAQAPFTLSHNADFHLARLCYTICRATRPAVIVETGVAYGVTSTYILQALAVNESGMLHSVDLPPLGRDADRFVGILIPPALKQRWRLHRGASKRVLPALLRRLGQIDLFIHDSLHTYTNMRWEFHAAASHLARSAVVIADDIEGNPAFQEWASAAQPAFSTTMREAEKPGMCGLSIFC